MDKKTLEAFVRLYERKSLRRTAEELHSDALRAVPFAEPFRWPVYLAWRRTGVLSPGGRALRRFLTDRFGVS